MAALPRPPLPPSYARPLVGREGLVVETRARLSEGGQRLVTLLGAAGIGKTRVAAAVVREVAKERPAVWVDLAPLSTRADVVASIARGVGLELDAASDEADTLARLTTRLHLASNLLALDNCEHVLDTVADLLGHVLAEDGGLQVLTTSRVRLGLEIEEVLVVPPLSEQAATELLLTRCRARASGEILADDAASIVRLLDGVPLAIELAAARTRVIDGKTLRSRLEEGIQLLRDATRDRPARHRSLDAALDGSFQLLDPEARTALGGLACFSGSFTARAAAVVLGEPLDATLDRLQSLADHSLLHVEQEIDGTLRFRMFEALRQFASTRLRAKERATFQLRLARHAAAEGARLSDWSTVLDEERARLLWLERGNLRSTLTELGPVVASATDAEACVEAANALASLYFARGPWSEALAVLDAAGCAAWFAEAPRAARAELLWKRGFIRAAAERTDEARVDLEAAARLVDGGPARDGVLRTLATLELERGAVPLARKHADRALSEAVASGDPAARSLAQATLSQVAQAEGKLDEAMLAIDRAIEIEVRELAAPIPALYRAQRASVLQDEGRLAEARVLLAEVVADIRARGLRAYLGRFLASLGALCLEEGDLEAARDLLDEALGTSSATEAHAVFCAVGRNVIAARSAAPLPAWPVPRRESDARLVELGVAITDALAGRPVPAGTLLSPGPYGTAPMRCLQRILHGLLPGKAPAEGALRVDPRGRAYSHGGRTCDLARRPVLGRLLLALAKAHLTSPGAVVDASVLVETVWPGERLPKKVASNRLQVAIHDLRATGLERLLETHPGGYRLDPAIQVHVEGSA
ncbi:MAG: AAA family ATPase [Myxococcales bacterium]|nr:AAA family ATPase [Myxococcales bacterium]